MIERLLENWLDSASERSYQIPFTQMLVHQGKRIIHSTRHSPIEFGKDIIAVDKLGQVHAYQLKGVNGKKLSLEKLREIFPQLQELVSAKINHPAIKAKKWHKSYLVLNGEIEEEASELLAKTNEGFEEQGLPERRIELILRGELLDISNQMVGNLIPQELEEFRLLLELYLEDGGAFLPKERFAKLNISCLPYISNNKKPKIREFSRTITSLALINSLSMASFTKKNNYFAEITAWTIYLSSIFAVIEKNNIPEKYWEEFVTLIEDWIFLLLQQLVVEIRQEPDNYEGVALTEIYVHRTKVTLLESICSLYALWCLYKDKRQDDLIPFCKEYIKENYTRIQLSGEGAVPQLITIYWLLRRVDGTLKPDFWLAKNLEDLLKLNRFDSNSAIPNFYYDAESVLLSMSGDPKCLIDDNFAGQSFASEALMHLFVRRNWKLNAKMIWADYTRVMNSSVKLDYPWRTYLWRNSDGAENISAWPQRTKNWEQLKEEANESSGQGIPALLKKHPHLFVLFLIIYPHRLTSESVRWLDTFWKAYKF